MYTILYKINLVKVKLHLKYNTIISVLFTVLATWVIFTAIPFLRLKSAVYPQIDTQIVLLHLLCGTMFFYFQYYYTLINTI